MKMTKAQLKEEEHIYSPCEHNFVSYKEMVRLCRKQHSYIKAQNKRIVKLYFFKKNIEAAMKRLKNLKQRGVFKA